MRTLVLGLGNPILSDDGVGIHVVRAVAARLASTASRPDVSCAEASVGGLRLLDIIAGYDRVILVDAIQMPGGKPGQIYRLGPEDLLQSRHSGSTHDLTLAGALALGRGLRMTLPPAEAIMILAIEVEDVCTFGESCTRSVAAAIPRAVEAVLRSLVLSASKGAAPLALAAQADTCPALPDAVQG